MSEIERYLALKKLAYSYHYQNKDKEMIFRFDNAEHHTEVRTCFCKFFLCHKKLKVSKVKSV